MEFVVDIATITFKIAAIIVIAIVTAAATVTIHIAAAMTDADIT